MVLDVARKGVGTIQNQITSVGVADIAGARDGTIDRESC